MFALCSNRRTARASLLQLSRRHGPEGGVTARASSDLPTIDWFEWGGRHFRISHATPQVDLLKYLTPYERERRVRDLGTDYVMLGHTCIQDMAPRRPRDSDQSRQRRAEPRSQRGKACYAVFDGERVTLKRVTYEFARTIAALRASPLPRSVVRHLELALLPDAAGDVDD